MGGGTLWTPGESWRKVVAREMGTTTAPVVGSGSCPAKMARVPNPQVAALPKKESVPP